MLHRQKQPRRLVDRRPRRKQPVIPQYQRLIIGPQRFRDIPPLLLPQHHPTMIIIHRMRLVELTRILRQHLQRPAEHGPRLPVHRMRVAHGVNIVPRLVHGLMDQEASLVDRLPATTRVEHRAIVHAHEDHVGGGDETPVDADRVGPEGVGELGVADGDVAGQAFDEALAEPVAEGGGEVVLDVSAVSGVGWEDGDAGEGVGSVAESG